MWGYNSIWASEFTGQMTCLAAVLSSNAAGVDYLCTAVFRFATSRATTKLELASWA
jgi:hypothetical protein